MLNENLGSEKEKAELPVFLLTQHHFYLKVLPLNLCKILSFFV